MKVGKNIKYFLVEFGIAFLLGIAGFSAMGYIFVAIPYSGGYGDDKTGVFFTIFSGAPLGSGLGILITKTFILRTAKFSVFSVLSLVTSVICGYLAGRYLWPATPDYMFDLMGPGLSDVIVFPLITLFALIAYNTMSVLLKSRK